MTKSIEAWCAEISEWRAGKGFETPADLDSMDARDQMLGKLMLVVCEAAEAAEAVRHRDIPNFREELADAVIRIFDICGTMGIDLEADIEAKMAVNRGRPYLHGKDCSI